MREWLTDLRFAWRSHLSHPGFTLTALLTLALGIGVNTAVFSIVNALLLRPLPVSSPEQLVEVYTSDAEVQPYGSTSYPDYRDLRDQNTVFSGLAAHSLMFANLQLENRPQLLIGEIVSGNYFDVLGLRPALGRFFLPEEDATEETHPVAVLSHSFWVERYASDPSALGKFVRLNGKDYSIVGVAPASFRGGFHGLSPQLWIPTMMAAEIEPVGLQESSPSPSGNTIIERRGRRWLFLKGRLKPGATIEQADAQLKSIFTRLQSEYPISDKGRSANLLPSSAVRFHPALDGPLAPAGGFLLAAVGLVLLVACANVANMFLARASARRREMALRIALGAGRSRIVRLLLTESLLIALAGGAAGVLLAVWGNRLLLSIRPPLGISLDLNADPDYRVLLYALFISVATGILFGLAPALQSIRPGLIPALKEGWEGATRRRRRFDLRKGLVLSQIALSVLLLVGAGLLTRSLHSARNLNPGFDPKGLAIVGFNLDMDGYDDQRSRRFYDDLLRGVRAQPGVLSAGVASRLPFSMNVHQSSFFPGETQPRGESGLSFEVSSVAPGYFSALGVPLLEGRDIQERDRADAPKVAVVSAALARRLWPGESALGKRITERDGATREVVGVVDDYKIRTLGESPRPIVHFARDQYFHPAAELLVRGTSAAAALEASRRTIQALDPDVLVWRTNTMADQIDVSLFGVSMGALLLRAFSFFALFLASVGLYGVIAYSVSRRTREIGTRMALGATRSDVLKLVVREGMTLVMAGLAAGLAGAVLLGRTLSALLYEVGPNDPLTFGLAAAVLASVALLANYLPARRASRMDPLVALRCE